MTAFKSYSQAAQDRFVWEVLGGKTDGTFLDVGACHPTQISNTYALEQQGWRGLLIDNDLGAVELCRQQRKSPVIHGDATSVDWNAALDAHLPSWRGRSISYLSLDIDEASFDALTRILNEGVVFDVITTEHDQYRNGDRLRAPMRNRLGKHDYVLICADVCSTEGLSFEDWWVTEDLADHASRFRSTGKKWTEIFPT